MSDLDPSVTETATEIAPLVRTLRESTDWPSAVRQVTDQIEQMSHDNAQTYLLIALVTIAGMTTR